MADCRRTKYRQQAGSANADGATEKLERSFLVHRQFELAIYQKKAGACIS